MARFFFIFHTLSFKLNFFFDWRCPLSALEMKTRKVEKVITALKDRIGHPLKCL